MPMITLSDAGSHDQSWQWHLQHAIRNIPALASYLRVQLDDIDQDFPLLAPLPYLDRVSRGDAFDPLLLQILPRSQENESGSQYLTDPLREGNLITGTRGLIQKYSSRALVITTGACAINCRYCFRRHFPYGENNPSSSDWNGIYRHLASDTSLTEVILSGGDPLILGDRQLKDIITNLESIASIDTIRLHTRLPVVIPQRICPELLDWVSRCRKKVVFVLHTNHPNEIDDHVINAARALRDAGATLLNQSVLLRDINDTPEVLVKLSRQLFAAGILPYYLHLLDPVAGAQHFDVAEVEGVNLIRQISGQLPGYLVPRLAREIPGADAKQVIAGQ
ncbi:MAG: EF-P beta-lysylation protein EpmB [Candidatus Azotimanducaceae bacterium WSBS_2022_MAG_OTU7]